MDVLDHHDRAVHQDAEVDGADRQQIRGDVLEVETDEREQEREWDGGCDDQPRSDVVEKEDQHDDHEHDAAEEVVLDGARGQGYEVAAIVIRPDLYVLGQHMFVQVARTRFHPLENGLRLLARTHEDDPFHRIIALVEAELSEARRVADLDGRDILHEDGDAVLHRQHDVGDVGGGADEAQSAHVVELASLCVESAARVPVVRAERILDVLNAEAGAGELRRVDDHVVFHRLAAECGEVRHTRHGLERLGQHPIVDDLQLHRRSVGALHDIAIDEAGGRKERLDPRAHAGRQRHVRKSLERALPREIGIGAIAEGQDDVRESIERDRPHKPDVLDAVHFRLDGHGHEPLDFLGGMSRPLRHDFDAWRREIRVRVDRQPRERPDADTPERQREDDDEERLREGAAHEPVDHRCRRGWGRVPLMNDRLAHWLSANWMNRAPLATTLSPAVFPVSTSYRSSTR